MPTTPLAIPDKARTLAFRGFVSFIQRDPVLARVVKKWQVWSGEANEDDMPEASGLLPLVRITPMTAASSRKANLANAMSILESPFIVKIETAVAGSNFADSWNLWGAIEDRVFSQDVPTRLANDAALAELGIMDVEQIQPGLGTFEDNMTTAIGLLKVTMFIPN